MEKTKAEIRRTRTAWEGAWLVRMPGWGRMNRATLQCVIRTKEGVEVEKSEEIWGEGKTYLASLSDSLSRMQSDVNAYLTELVEKERGQAAKSGLQPTGDSGEGSSDEDGKGSCPFRMLC